MKYRIASKQFFSKGEFDLLPIRHEDRYKIMQWRNEQLYHLRQNEPLTKEKQDWYFDNVVSSLFDEPNPNQFLFSFLKVSECIGYGGLVHINWIDKNAEISFILDTKLEREFFSAYWTIYLSLIEEFAFQELKLHKLYVYAFDLRPQLYEMLESNHYFLDARLKDHCYFKGAFKDVVIYSKIR